MSKPISSLSHHEVLDHGYYIQTLHDFAGYVKEKGIDKVLEDLKQLGYGEDMVC